MKINNKLDDPSLISPLVRLEKFHLGSIYSVDWGSTGKYIGTCSNDKSVRLLMTPQYRTREE